jgi:hypothetical protein
MATYHAGMCQKETVAFVRTIMHAYADRRICGVVNECSSVGNNRFSLQEVSYA